MKFLVLALCVSAASAASFGNQPFWQRNPQQVNQAFASAAVTAPRPSYEAVQQPFVKAFGQSNPAPVAPVIIKPYVPTTPVEVPIATVAKAVFTAPIAAANAAFTVPTAADNAAFTAPIATANAAFTAPIAAPIAAAKAVNYNNEAKAAILRLDSDISPAGFNFVFETENGIAAQSSGNLKNVNNEQVLGIQGSYQFRTPEGIPVQVSYTADENGFQPQGNLLPVGPPTPEYITRALEYIRTHPQKEEKIDYVLVNKRHID